MIMLFLIGNSLSWDLYNGYPGENIGAHIETNKALIDVMNAIPPDLSRGADDWRAAAASGLWTQYYAQPFYHESLESIQNDLDLIESTTGREAVVYASLPFKHQWNRWDSAFTPDAFEPSLQNYAYFDQRVLPAGHVAQKLVADGTLTVEQLYRDQIHASGIGRQVLGHTLWAFANEEYPEFSPYAEQIWETLYPGDFNHDLIVDGEDFLLWQVDGSVGDFLVWQQEFSSRRNISVPSPESLIVLTFIALSSLLIFEGCYRELDRNSGNRISRNEGNARTVSRGATPSGNPRPGPTVEDDLLGPR